VKALLLALTAVAVCYLPALSLPQFLWTCGVFAGVVGSLLLGIFMGMVIDAWKLYRGYRAFEKATADVARKLTGRRSRMRLVP
jgi:hypothetical protein